MESSLGRGAGPGPLDDLLLYAGASMARDGSASHYGSAVGELAVCLHAVGLADRHELRTFELRGGPDALDEAAERVTGRHPPAGVAARFAGAWWCRVAHDRALLACGRGVALDLPARLDGVCRGGDGLAWTEVRDRYEALALVGPSSAAVLAATCPECVERLGSVGRFARLTAGGAAALVLREGETQYLVLVSPGEAVAVWQGLEAAGVDFHMATVGRQALDRFEVGHRTQAH